MMVFRDEQYSPETTDAAPEGAHADTTIYVNPPAQRPVPQPILTAPAPSPAPVTQTVTGTESTTTNSVTQPASLTQQYSTKQVTTKTHDMSGPKTKEHTGINWGGVVKGAAIVAAVVVAGVAVFAGASALTGWALGQPVIASVAATVGEAAAPVLTAASEGAAWLTGFVPHIPAAIGNFFSAAFGAGGAAATAAGATGTGAAAAALSGTAIAGAKTAVGTLAAGGAVAYAASTAIPALDHTSVLSHTQVTTLPADHVTTTTTVTATPPVPADAASSTEIVHHAGDGHAAHTAADLGLHSFEFAHSNKGHNGHDTSAQADTVAPDVDTSASGDVSAPDVDISESDLNKITSRAQRNWASRASSNGFADTAKTGGYRAAVAASRSNESSEIKQRGNDYRMALAEDRAKLDATLATPSL